MQKQKWCNSAGSYYNCLKSKINNCFGNQYADSVSYYEKIQKYVHSQANINCPGGIEGCIANPNDVRCKMGVKYGEANSSKTNLNFSRTKIVFKMLSFFFIYLVLIK